MTHGPTPLQTLQAMVRGHLPRLFQGRGWTLAAVALLPALLAVAALMLLERVGEGIPATGGLKVFHGIYAHFLLPVLALLSAPAGIREDLEQRTLPLILTRPAQAWMLPFAKGVLWYGWTSGWLILAVALLPLLGTAPEHVPAMAAALLLAHWAHLGLMSYLVQRFKRGLLWGSLILFIWDPLVRILPGRLQYFTFLHHFESLAGSRGGNLGTMDLLNQTPLVTHPAVAALVLILAGGIAWAACGARLQATPYGLAGRESEG